MNDTQQRIALTVGPVLYYWPRTTLLQFYADLAETPADTIVVGEAVCSRRHELKPEDWLDLARDLRATGKEVMLATQVLVQAEADLRVLRRMAEQRDVMVEAGDASALHLLVEAGLPFVLGPHINIYSRAALEQHARLGAVRWVAPVELPLSTVGQINPPDHRVVSAGERPRAVATEVFAFGRMPLAFSARCFTARHHHLTKDLCEFRCLDDPDGLLLGTEDGQPFLVLNGIQTQSAAQQCLIGERAALRAAGATRLRLSPCSQRFGEVVGWFDKVMNHGESADAARIALDAMSLPGGLANGFAHGRPGLDMVSA